jgi:hypothetical protein
LAANPIRPENEGGVGSADLSERASVVAERASDLGTRRDAGAERAFLAPERSHGVAERAAEREERCVGRVERSHGVAKRAPEFGERHVGSAERHVEPTERTFGVVVRRVFGLMQSIGWRPRRGL